MSIECEACGGSGIASYSNHCGDPDCCSPLYCEECDGNGVIYDEEE